MMKNGQIKFAPLVTNKSTSVCLAGLFLHISNKLCVFEFW
jgi:hypothetical protein